MIGKGSEEEPLWQQIRLLTMVQRCSSNPETAAPCWPREGRLHAATLCVKREQGEYVSIPSDQRGNCGLTPAAEVDVSRGDGEQSTMRGVACVYLDSI